MSIVYCSCIVYCACMSRYIKYFSRYDGHDKSIKFAGRQREAALSRMSLMMDQAAQGGGGGAFIEVEYLLRAVDQASPASPVQWGLHAS